MHLLKMHNFHRVWEKLLKRNTGQNNFALKMRKNGPAKALSEFPEAGVN